MKIRINRNDVEKYSLYHSIFTPTMFIESKELAVFMCGYKHPYRFIRMDEYSLETKKGKTLPIKKYIFPRFF